ncbi:MAG: AraC-like DNA-binding protein [Oleispira sp.]
MNLNSAVPIFKPLVYLSGKRSMYVGPLKRLLVQSNSLTTLIISIDKELGLMDNNSGLNYVSKSFLIPAGSHVTVDTNDSIIVFCFLNTLGTDLAKLIPSMRQSVHLDDGSTCYSGIPNELAVIEQAGDIFKRRPSAEAVFERLDNWIENSSTVNTCMPDARISMAISLITRDYARNVSIDEIAKAVRLSAPRLIQLFKQVTGIPIRRFRLCHRIFVTLLNLGSGMSLTNAVVEAGFSDYAHFSRIFKELGSVKPSELLSSRNLVDLRVLSKPITTKLAQVPSHEAC